MRGKICLSPPPNTLCHETAQATKAEQQLRQPFESAIKRPYYHFKPLDPAQLTNWEHYLAWSESQREAGATVALFERCLVPCANYPGEAAPAAHAPLPGGRPLPAFSPLSTCFLLP